ncbi:MAG: hypothetical protein EON88_16900 [Brevundimonas sp.]|nr:MAG: hypothetical protein EON88_16900 [Brevundimonas sp.]
MIRSAMAACALVMTVTSPALSGETAASARTNTATRAQVMVTVCERDALTQAAFRRQNGPTPAYVTADQVMDARAAGERWATSRCMTDRQHRELVQRLTPRSPR